MDKNKVEIIAILDRSGSMQGKEIDTIGGYNSLIEKQKKLKKDVCVTLVLFDSNNPCEVVYENKKINDVPILDSNTYFARGCTPLLDAIGKSIVSVNERYKNASATEVPANVICLIITDGLENDSKEYKREQIKKLVENQKDKFNWEFIFLGANIDSFGEARSIGISATETANYAFSSRGFECAYSAASSYITGSIFGSSTLTMSDYVDIENKKQ